MNTKEAFDRGAMEQFNAQEGRAKFVGRLRAAADKLGFLAKDARNEHFGYDYASEASVKRAVRAALAEIGRASWRERV